MTDDKSIPHYRGFDDDVASEVQNLARSLNSMPKDEKTLWNTFSNISQIPGINPMCEDPKLDPGSDEFDSKF